MFVLDEADEMLSRGFKDQIYDVFRKMPSSIQVILLSATMPVDVLDVTHRFMRDPIRILVKKEELTLEGIKQFYVQVEKEVRENACVVSLEGGGVREKICLLKCMIYSLLSKEVFVCVFIFPWQP